MDHNDNEKSNGEEKDDSILVSSEGGDVNRSESVERLMEFAQQFKKQDSS